MLAMIATCVALIAPSAARAAVITFGSDLQANATLDTGSPTLVTGLGPSSGHPSGLPTPHFGVDTSIWNVVLAHGASQQAPADGEVLSIRLKGCAVPALGFTPDTAIHFQTLTRQVDGTFLGDLSDAQVIPVCGNGVDGTTATTYTPHGHLCVSRGDFVAFNDEGGFQSGPGGTAGPYGYGVPYLVIGSVQGSAMDAYLKNNGTGNGSTLSPSDALNPPAKQDGFATERNEELLLQATLGTGVDANGLCPGGLIGVAQPTKPTTQPVNHGPAVVLHDQTDGVNHARFTAVAIFCALLKQPCVGTVTLTAAGAQGAKRGTTTTLGSAHFTLSPNKTGKVRMRLTIRALNLIRKHHRRLKTTMTVSLTPGGPANTFAHTITLKI